MERGRLARIINKLNARHARFLVWIKRRLRFFDTEFEKETKMLFQRLENKEVIFVISEVLTDELDNAPENVKTLLGNYSGDYFKEVPLTDEARRLADKYIAENVVGKASYDDCCHIALATIHKVDVLASWNFKHI